MFSKAALFPLLVISLTAGCGRRSDPQHVIQPEYDKQTGRLQVLRYDADGDGKIDTISHMDGSRVLFIEIDKNEDGRTDRWEYYDEAQRLTKIGVSRADDGKEDAWSFARADGSIQRIDISLARDGKVTRREYYENAVMVRAEEDSDADGVVDKWETYEGDRLLSVAFDATHRGKPDRRLIYAADGAVRVEIDPEGDGTFVPEPAGGSQASRRNSR